MGSVDVDSDGYIRYREFVRKLSRHGVKSRTSEEQIIYLIVESLRRTGIKSLAKAFELFDKERRGSLSREDFKDVFKNMKLKIEEGDVDKFIDHFWKDKKAGIDYQEFLRIFSRYQIKLDENENKRKVAYDRIPDDVLRLKKRIYVEMNKAFTSTGKSLKNLFDRVDIDNSNQIEFEEFKGMF
jgi:Ca2+-binding EF-hand superfamily protein